MRYASALPVLPVLVVAFAATACVTTSLSEAPESHIARLTRASCGATFSLQSGDAAGSGRYAVSVYPEATRTRTLPRFPEEADLRAFIDANADVLRRRENAVGTWCEGAGGASCAAGATVTCYLDISRTVAARDEAVRLARACNQRAIARLGRGEVEIIDNDGNAPLGDGTPLSGEALARCVKARD